MQNGDLRAHPMKCGTEIGFSPRPRKCKKSFTSVSVFYSCRSSCILMLQSRKEHESDVCLISDPFHWTMCLRQFKTPESSSTTVSDPWWVTNVRSPCPPQGHPRLDLLYSTQGLLTPWMTKIWLAMLKQRPDRQTKAVEAEETQTEFGCWSCLQTLDFTVSGTCHFSFLME